MKDTPFDYGVDAVAPSMGDNMKKALIDAADKQEKLEVELAKLQEEMEKKSSALKELAENTIPQIMDGLKGVIDLGDGRTIEIAEKIRASIAGEKAAPAVAWLDENGHGNIVKRQFIIEFSRDDEAWAKKFEADLKKRKKPLNVMRKQSVHPQTLEAFVREQLGTGVELPIATFGIYRQRISKIKHEGVNETPKLSRKKKSEDRPDF